MCTVPLPPGVYLIAVDKYINNTLNAVITAVRKKHLSTKYNIAQPDGCTPMDVINAPFALSIKKGPREKVLDERAAMMMMTTTIIIIIK